MASESGLASAFAALLAENKMYKDLHVQHSMHDVRRLQALEEDNKLLRVLREENKTLRKSLSACEEELKRHSSSSHAMRVEDAMAALQKLNDTPVDQRM